MSPGVRNRAGKQAGEKSPPHLCTIQHLAERYAFPPALSGKGECIAILEFGGSVAANDFDRYFLSLNRPVPDIHFENLSAIQPLNVYSEHDKEVALDIEVAGALAPGARIVAYFSTNDEKGWIHAVSRALYDTKHRPSVLCISWGAAEDWWTEGTVRVLNRLFAEAAGMGITICAASGDDGCATNGSGYCRVNFPASSPFVLACGGTVFHADGSEVVWNVRNRFASGGGISDILERPSWQARLCAATSQIAPRRDSRFDGRQLPDVAGPAGDYNIYVGGCYRSGMGTSAAAAFWSALVARINEGLKIQGLPAVGFLNSLLYKDHKVQQTFNSVAEGQNDPFAVCGYRACPAWNPCTGWGTPHGEKLLNRLLELSRGRESGERL